ncbi:MAG: hypothetical protein SFU25_09855 [Candidatus Caenarcaniphilales bacterium]|nr:hypothetical protein [Candidatus Caenarcaniphilales bacterium]
MLKIPEKKLFRRQTLQSCRTVGSYTGLSQKATVLIKKPLLNIGTSSVILLTHFGHMIVDASSILPLIMFNPHHVEICREGLNSHPLEEEHNDPFHLPEKGEDCNHNHGHHSPFLPNNPPHQHSQNTHLHQTSMKRKVEEEKKAEEDV